jgi:phosphoribosylaminoimidazolecarboxamide formyltransferase/IMP cyclohydrolase
VAAGACVHGPHPTLAQLRSLDVAYRAAHAIGRPGCGAVQQTSVCGLASAASQSEAVRATLTQATGRAVLACNTQIEAQTLQALLARVDPVIAVAAPGFDPEALRLAQAAPSLSLVQVPPGDPAPRLESHRIGGGLLVQQARTMHLDHSAWRLGAGVPWAAALLQAAAMAVLVARLNPAGGAAIATAQTLVGAAGGQAHLHDAVRLALEAAGSQTDGAVLAVDTPISTLVCVELAIECGIAGLLAPTGGAADADCAALCEAHGVGLMWTEAA